MPDQTAFGGQHHLIAPSPDRAADHLFGMAQPIGRRGVDQGDPFVQPGTDGVLGRGVVGAAPHPPADRPGAKTHCRCRDAGRTDLSFRHLCHAGSPPSCRIVVAVSSSVTRTDTYPPRSTDRIGPTLSWPAATATTRLQRRISSGRSAIRPLVQREIRHLPAIMHQMPQKLGHHAQSGQHRAVGCRQGVQIEIGRAGRRDRPDADKTDGRPARQIKNFLHRTQVHQHLALVGALGEQRRMQLQRPPAQPFGHARGQMVDIGVVLSLHAAGQGHHLHVDGPFDRQGVHHGRDGLAARNAKDVAVAQRFGQMRGGGLTDLRQPRAIIVRHGGRDDGRADKAGRRTAVAQAPSGAGRGSRC